MNIAFILKGDIHHRRQFEREYAELQAALSQAQLTLLESEYPGHACELAAQCCGQYDFLVAVGGDGTLNEVLNGSLRVNLGDPARRLPVFGVLAHGTANDLARSLRISGSMQELAALLRSASHRPIDVGRLQCRSEAGEALERYFLNVADIGIGARVIQHLSDNHLLLGGNLHYLRAVLRTFLKFHPSELRVESDTGLRWRGKTLALVAANGSYFGSGLCVAPGATLDDGQMFITLVGDAHITDFIRNLRRLKRGIRLDHPKAQYHHGRRLEVMHMDEPAAVEADGEFLGYTPAQIELMPAAIEFLLPEEAGGSAESHTQ